VWEKSDLGQFVLRVLLTSVKPGFVGTSFTVTHICLIFLVPYGRSSRSFSQVSGRQGGGGPRSSSLSVCAWAV